jgi:hypothetical protein
MPRRPNFVAAAAMIALRALAGCATEDGRALHVAGNYKPLSACLHAELARDEPGVLVGYAIDEPGQRARIWRDDDNRSFQSPGGGGFAAYNIYLAQTGAHDVTIRERDRTLYFGATDFMNRLIPMVRRCVAETGGAASN